MGALCDAGVVQHQAGLVVDELASDVEDRGGVVVVLLRAVVVGSGVLLLQAFYAETQGAHATWTSLFAGFASTQHLVSNYVTQPSDSGLSVHVAFRAVHFGNDPYGSPSWTLYGRYHIDLVPDGPECRITGLHQTPTAGEGNRNIVLLAAAGSQLAQP